MTTVVVTSAATSPIAPFSGEWESHLTGYCSSAAQSGAQGSISPNNNVGSNQIVAAGYLTFEGSPYFILVMSADTPETFFSSVAVTLQGGGTNTYERSGATYYATGASVFGIADSEPGPTWVWADPNSDFVESENTTLDFGGVIAPVDGQGDITDPESWADENGNIPPLQYSNVPSNVNYPLNGDGRYWFSVNAETPTGGPINFIGNPEAFIDSAVLQWSVVQAANDGSSLVLSYSTDGETYTDVTLAPTLQLGSLQNGVIIVPLAPSNTPVTQLYVNVTASGGTASDAALPWQIALAITRNVNEGITWDSPNPFNPANYNGAVLDTAGIPVETLAELQSRIMVRLGFPNQASNPPPGMAALVQDFLIGSQNYLYKRYMQLHTKRLFRWKINPGQRFYSLGDSDQDVLAANAAGAPNPQIDPQKRIEWAGIQDSRNVWYPLIQGIPPQLYTMITKPWRPARYAIHQCIELYPMPDQTYWLWVKGHFGLLPFASADDNCTIDSELLFLWALATAKAHYGQPDAGNIASMANNYRAELIASSHQTAHYIPGTIAVPPAVRPTLIQFDNNPAA